jgi:hypothetical protein
MPQVRLVDLERAAIKPFAAHRAKVRALTAVSRGMWVSLRSHYGPACGHNYIVAAVVGVDFKYWCLAHHICVLPAAAVCANSGCLFLLQCVVAGLC